jgi:hypothetical protein
MTLSEFGHRRLRASQGGLWFVGLTVLVGLVAMASGNNVLYVIECFLLGLFVVYGLVSEFFIRQVTVTFFAKGSFAGQRARDLWVVRNNSRLPIFGLSFGFRFQNKFIVHARLLYLAPRQTAVIESHHHYVTRGPYRSEGMFVQTDAPFGFATKIRFDKTLGERLVWAAPKAAPLSRVHSRAEDTHSNISTDQRASHRGHETLYGALGDGDHTASARDIVWSQSFRIDDEIKTKLKTSDDDLQTFVIDQRPGSRPLNESEISQFTKMLLSRPASRLKVLQERRALTLVTHEAFDFLAQLPASEAA